MLACRAMPCGLWCMPVCPKAGPLPSAVMGRCGWPMLPAGVWPSPKTKKGPPLRASSSTLRSRASSSTSAARRHCRSGGGGVGWGGPTRGFTVRNPVALVRLPATSLPSAPLHSRPPASPLVRCRRGDGMQQPHAQTVASAAGITSVQIQKNRILGSNSKPFTGIILKKPQQVGPLPLHVRGSIASSPQKLFSPKAAAPKSGDSIRIAVLGASGYTGAEIVRFLANHPQFHIKVMTADRKAGEQFGSVFPHLRTLDLPKLVAIKDADFSDIDAVFCCLPHGTTQEIIKSLPRHLKIVDLSADFRLRDINEYAEWYGHSHRAPELQEEAVYGLTELQRDDIRNARLVANPGCYPTSIQLPLVPLVKAKLIKLTNIIIDAKSGVSGAGRGAKEANLYTEIAEGIHAYGITSHRHVPEIEQGLTDAAESKVTISFTPHLMCMKRGMQSTIYVELASGVTPRDLYEHLKYTYEDEEFVKLLHGSSAPHTSHVVGSNYCFMNVYEDRIPGRAIIISVIDNLVKGASGQALQNLNLMMGLPENMGLQYLPLFP